MRRRRTHERNYVLTLLGWAKFNTRGKIMNWTDKLPSVEK